MTVSSQSEDFISHEQWSCGVINVPRTRAACFVCDGFCGPGLVQVQGSLKSVALLVTKALRQGHQRFSFEKSA